MRSTTVRIDSATRQALTRLAAETHLSVQTILSQAVEAYRRQVFLAHTNQAYAELRQDPNAWAECQEERALWNRTTGDGL